MPARYARKHNISESLETTGNEMPAVVFEQASELRHGFERWAFAADKVRARDEDPGDIPELNEGFGDLHSSLQDIFELHPGQTIPILEHLAQSVDPTTRFMAVSKYHLAYFLDPEGSRPLITELLQDADPRVVTFAHEVLQMHGSDAFHGERDGDERGNMSLEFIASLPIHHMTAEVSDEGRVVRVTPRNRHVWWPVSSS